MSTAPVPEDDWQSVSGTVEDAPAELRSIQEFGFLNEVISQSVGKSESRHSDVEGLLNGQISIEETLNLCFPKFRQQVEEVGFEAWRRTSLGQLSFVISEIDRLVSAQVDSVLHHERLQKLEASWRGLKVLLDAARENYDVEKRVKIKLLNASWRDVQRDFDRASEFDQSELFKKIYEDEFGSPGGQPFGAIVADYEIHPRPSASHPYDDVAILDELAGVAAAAFCPIVVGASPSLFGVDEFYELQDTQDLGRGFQVKEFVKWRAFREQEDARFIGIAMPRILLRKPYEFQDTQSFVYQEDTTADVRRVSHQQKHLWGNAGYAWASVLIRTFKDTGWLADIRGTERNRNRGGGLVTDLTTISFGTDRRGVATKSSTDLIITDRQEAELSALGFLPLCPCKDTVYSAFYSSQSVQKPTKYDSETATVNAHISSMLQYILCVSRFAHYLKVIARDLVGSMVEPEEMEDRLERWIQEYVTPDKSAKLETKARRPLSEAQVSVVPEPGKPGSYQCTFSLLPHYQLDQLRAAIRLKTSFSSTSDS